MRIGIVGFGTVGTFLHKIFSDVCSEIVIYDTGKAPYSAKENRDAINTCDLVFIAVPTPSMSSGECDISAVHNVTAWVEPPMCIKSTVVPGTTDMLTSKTGKKIVFSPEYVGETLFHKYRHNSQLQDMVTIGGHSETAKKFLELYKLALGPNPRYFVTSAINAELSKYMENCFFATKVAFVAQFHELATEFGADFDQVREMWVADTRVGLSHSAVIGELGFSGSCLPKDLSAMVFASASRGGAPILEAVLAYNNWLTKGQANREEGGAALGTSTTDAPRVSNTGVP